MNDVLLASRSGLTLCETLVPCRCGCGKRIPQFDTAGTERQFATGHDAFIPTIQSDSGRAELTRLWMAGTGLEETARILGVSTRTVWKTAKTIGLKKNRRPVKRAVREVGGIPAKLAARLNRDFGGMCAYECARKATAFDHVIPVQLGGKSVEGNLLPVCQPCNSSKGVKDVRAWLSRRGRVLSKMALAEIARGK